jgi:hypothetical protein
MTNDRGGKGMGDTAKSYAKEWLISEITNKKKDIKSKYLERGNAMEETAIGRVARHYNCKLEKNDVNLEDDFFTGTFDARNHERVIDTKVPFDAFTFPFFDEKINSDYFGQLQIYMHLTGLKKASLCYCLENGSNDQIDKLSWQLAKELGKEEVDIDDWDEAEKMLSYDDLPDNLRVKVFEFEYDADYIEKAKLRITQVREYIQQELLTELNK